MTQASATAPTAPIVPSALNLAGFRSPAEIAAGVPEKTQPAKPGDAAGVTAPPSAHGAAEITKPKRKPATKKAKAERKPRVAPLTRLERFNVDQTILAAASTETDAMLADRASAVCSRAVSVQYVKDARIALGLKSVPEPSKAEMRARLQELERQLEEATQQQLFGAGALAGANRALGQLLVGAANVVISDTLPDPVELAEASEQAAEQCRAVDTRQDEFGTFGHLTIEPKPRETALADGEEQA